MSTVPKRLLTEEEYLAKERLAEFKSEFYQGETFVMSGASWEHTLIKDNLASEARVALKGTGCQVLTSDLRVKVSPTGLYTYPDIVIVCDKPDFLDAKFDTLLNPRIIVEVLSESTEGYDRGTKFKHYRSLPSLQEYVLVSQDRPLIERYFRRENSWDFSDVAGLSEAFEFAAVAVRVPLSEIYAGVEFPDLALKSEPAAD